MLTVDAFENRLLDAIDGKRANAGLRFRLWALVIAMNGGRWISSGGSGSNLIMSFSDASRTHLTYTPVPRGRQMP